MTAPRVVRLSPEDNVVIAIDAVAAGATAAGQRAQERIPRGHKMAVEPIPESAPVKKFGQIIGFAARPIAPGDWVHEHNVTLHDFARDYRFAEAAKNDEVLPPELAANFQMELAIADGIGQIEVESAIRLSQHNDVAIAGFQECIDHRL